MGCSSQSMDGAANNLTPIGTLSSTNGVALEKFPSVTHTPTVTPTKAIALGPFLTRFQKGATWEDLSFAGVRTT